MRNLDPNTVSSFSDEWARFDQSGVTETEARKAFDEYFAVFPWAKLRIVGLSLPQRDYKKNLLTPRNEVSHGSRSITRAVAHGAIQQTDELLELLCPNIQEGE